MADIFARCLALATAWSPIVLFIDALDQLAPDDHALDVSWLSARLPAHVRVVASAIAAARRPTPSTSGAGPRSLSPR